MNIEKNDSIQDMPSSDPLAAGDGPEQIDDSAKSMNRSASKSGKSEAGSSSVGLPASIPGMLDDLAQVFKQTAGRLRERKKEALADVVEAGSEGLAIFSSDVRNKYPELLIGKIEEFARKRPAVFLGAALTAGVVVWRLSTATWRKSLDDREIQPVPLREEDQHGFH